MQRPLDLAVGVSDARACSGVLVRFLKPGAVMGQVEFADDAGHAGFGGIARITAVALKGGAIHAIAGSTNTNPPSNSISEATSTREREKPCSWCLLGGRAGWDFHPGDRGINSGGELVYYTAES